MLALAREMVPPMLWRAVRTFSGSAFISALDLLIPPLALLVGLYVGLIVLVSGLHLLGWINATPLRALLAVTSAIGLAVLGAWFAKGRKFITASTLAKIPGYVLWKLPIYVTLLSSGAPRKWERTERLNEKGQ